MKCARTWTGPAVAMLLCGTALACQEDHSLRFPKIEPVEARSAREDAGQAGRPAGDAGKQGQDAGSAASGAAESDGVSAAEDYGAYGLVGAGWRPSDAQILKLMSVVNEAEIAHADAALANLSDPRIRAFASHMVEAHGAALARQSALVHTLGSAPIASVLSANVEHEASGVLSRLENAAPSEIDRFYVDSQITTHDKLLDMLDRVLIPNAQDASLQSELGNTRSEVGAHLDEAEALSQALAGAR